MYDFGNVLYELIINSIKSRFSFKFNSKVPWYTDSNHDMFGI